MLGEELELTELPTAAVASADAAAHAGEQTLGMIRGWRENDWWQSGRAASAANGAEMGSIREVRAFISFYAVFLSFCAVLLSFYAVFVLNMIDLQGPDRHGAPTRAAAPKAASEAGTTLGRRVPS